MLLFFVYQTSAIHIPGFGFYLDSANMLYEYSSLKLGNTCAAVIKTFPICGPTLIRTGQEWNAALFRCIFATNFPLKMQQKIIVKWVSLYPRHQ